MTELTTRRAVDADQPFIVDSWVASFRTSTAAGPIPITIYRRVYREVIGIVLARPGVVAMIAETEGVLVGWAVCEPAYVARGARVPLVHFAFVKSWYRQRGIANALLRAASVDPTAPYLYTFRTGTGAAIAARHRGEWNPDAVRYSASPERIPK